MKKIYLIRHGETEWSKSGKHTSYSDLELTENGKLEALKVKQKLPHFDHIFLSPLKRAQQTAEILELKGPTLRELTEWNYGIYEGKKTTEIKKSVYDWNIFTHGALFGETILEVSERAKKVINHLISLDGNICIISSGHFIRVLIAIYLNQPCEFGKNVLISTASLTVLAEDRGIRVLETLNQRF